MAGPLEWHWARLQACADQTLLQSVPVIKHNSKQHHWSTDHGRHGISYRNISGHHWCEHEVVSLPHIWAKEVVHPSCLRLLGGSECLLNCHRCSETLSRQCRYGWENNILKVKQILFTSLTNHNKRKFTAQQQETTKTLNLLEIFRAMEVAECCQPGHGLLDL